MLTLGASAQNDVTSQYIVNPGFENSTPVEITECKGYGTTVLGNGYSLIANYATYGGYDYTDSGWKLLAQNTNANGGVVSYGGNVQYSKSGFEAIPTAGPLPTSGNNCLCVCGNNSLVYQQPAEITLPAGTYRLMVRLYPYNGAYSHETPTMKIKNQTGFVTTAGKEYFSQNLSDNKEITVNCNEWNVDVIEFELTESATGHLQVSYGTQYYLLIDDLYLEVETGVITTALKNVLEKAKALNEAMGGNNPILLDVIQSSEAFIANPTTQDDVAMKVQQAYDGMAAALTDTPLSAPVNLNVAYLENTSFETGVSPWTWDGQSGTVGLPINADSAPFIDGQNVVEFAQTGNNSLSQVIGHLPAGYYILDAKLNQNAKLSLGTSAADCVGGTDALYLRVHTPVLNFEGGDLTVNVKATKAYRVDDFRLFYSKDASQLLPIVYAKAKAEMQAILDDEQFAIITGVERQNLEYTINMEGTNLDELMSEMYAAATAFIDAKSDYKKFETAKTAAAAYSPTDYPYASGEIYAQIQALIGTVATSADNALALKEQLDYACFRYYVSNGYCEGVPNTDYTDHIVGANATEAATGWAAQNMAVRTDKTGWNNPKTGETDAVVYGVTSDYYRASANTASILKQTFKNLPAGDYVLSMTMMGSSDLPVYVFFNSELIGTMTGAGTYGGGKYGAGWNDYVFSFTKADDTDMPLQLQCKPTANYKEWYVDNFRLYRLESTVDEDTYGIVGDFSSWDNDLMLTKGEGDVYTLTIEDLEVKEVKTYEYKVRANQEWGGYELPAHGSDPQNLSWTPEKSGVYTLTFTFNPVDNTCTVEATRTDDCTWSVTFVNNGNWSEVWAYTWTNGADDQNNSWPGVKLADPVEGNVYTYSFKAEKAPAHIIFNNNGTEQTDNLDFVDGQEYSNVIIPAEINSVALSGEWNAWTTTDMMTKVGEGDFYSMMVDLTDANYNPEFKLLVNGGGDESDNWGGWIGSHRLTIDAPDGWITEGSDNSNLKLNHTTTGYAVYQVNATWTPNPVYYQGWTLHVVGAVATGIQTVDALTGEADKVFDLQGRRVAQPTKGLYIVNGKKVVLGKDRKF